jgi:inosose dehydratase
VKLAFSKPTLDDDEQRVLFGAFRSAGYDGVQLKGSQFLRYVPRPGDFIRDWSPPAGAVSGLIAGGRLDEAGIEALRAILAFAGGVAVERVVFCHGEPRAAVSVADLRRYARTLSDLGEEALERHGVKLSLHHHFDQPVMHREDFDTFFDEVREGTVGLTLDTAHLVKSGIDGEAIVRLIRDLSGVLDNVHLNEFDGVEFRVLGEGTIDFGPIVSALREVGYDGWLCADEESGSELIHGMSACADFIRSLLHGGRNPT